MYLQYEFYETEKLRLTEKKQIEIYQSEDGQTQIQVRLEKDTIWLSQAQMAELFDKNSDTIGLHLKNIYKSRELEKSATTEESSVVRQEGKRQVRRKIKFYNLDAIISVGYRVNSKKADNTAYLCRSMMKRKGSKDKMQDMLVKLYDLPELAPLVKSLANQGIVIRRAMAYEKLEIVDWVHATFGNGWASECDVAFGNHPTSCFIATEALYIIGFACHDSTCRNFFGPTGVAEKKRGCGIGSALLLSCLHAMAASDYAYAIIGGADPTEFYANTVGAMPIHGSAPGIYRDPLKKKIIENDNE